MILSQKQRMKITWIFSETSLGSWSIKATLHEGGYCGEGNRTNLILVLYGNVSTQKNRRLHLPKGSIKDFVSGNVLVQ